MTEQYLTYQRFNDISTAELVGEKLSQYEIEFLIEDNSRFFDISFANNSVTASINLKIQPQDFQKADKVLGELYQNSVDNVDKDYYLFNFTDEELKDVITKQDEWGHFDFQLAQKILKDKGISVDSNEIEIIKQERITTLGKPDSVNSWAMLFAFLFSIIAGWYTLLGGFVGILMGWALAYFKKTLPDGQSVYAYNEKARKQGKFLIVISSIVIAVSYVFRFYYLKR
ncbi:MAG: hypothetical protein QM737_22055 [Ferruginibacter sp.]